jgi:hypothetical protein
VKNTSKSFNRKRCTLSMKVTPTIFVSQRLTAFPTVAKLRYEPIS